MIKDTLTPEQLQKELKKMNMVEIADKYGVTKQYISQLYTEYQSTHPELFPKKTVSEEWLRKALKTKTVLQICNDTGLSYHRIRNLIAKYGIEKDTVTAKLDEATVRRLYVTLWWPDSELAAHYGCSVSLIKQFRYENQIFKTERLPLSLRLTEKAARYLSEKLQLSFSDICRVYDAPARDVQKLLSTYGVDTPESDRQNVSINDVRAYILSEFVEE